MAYYLQVKNNNIVSASTIPVSDVDIQNVSISENLYREYMNDHNKFYVENGEIKTKTEEQQKQEILSTHFFNTSLGYVKRKFTNKNGEVKDFLSDALPLLKVGIPILTYSSDFEQSKVFATQEFLEECGQQVLKDFYGE